MKFIPLNKSVFVKRIGVDETKTASGIIINSEIKQGEEVVKAEIIAISVYNDDLLKIGDVAYFQRNKADLTRFDGIDSDVEHYLISEDDILAVEE